MAILAKDVMTVPVITVKADTPLKRAAEILDENFFSGMPVVNDADKLVGIISETDILRYTQQIIGQPLRDPHRVFTKSQEVLHIDITRRGVEVIELVAATTVETLMTTDVIYVVEDAPFHKVISLMYENNINRIPVVDSNGELKGIITRADIIRILVDSWSDSFDCKF
ncbi:MAG: CBS domain-containing protein [Firmicutes bacterium]|nr:CBS domain-containing protein [Bacillota bacterium]